MQEDCTEHMKSRTTQEPQTLNRLNPKCQALNQRPVRYEPRTLGEAAKARTLNLQPAA